MFFCALSLSAQETYENARLMTEDLNGTARYVGMGGAMDALGADLSTIGTNPAGIGLFRHSTASVSFGFVSQPGAQSFANVNKTNMSFDQAGFVYSCRTGKKSFVNFAFNYHKSSNFNYILSAANGLSGASQNKLSYLKGSSGIFDVGVSNGGYIVGSNDTYNQVDYLYYNAFLTTNNDDGSISYGYNDATGYAFNRANSGYISEYDFNISGNIDDRLYLGFTLGIHDVHYNGYAEYTESLVSSEGTSIGSVTLADDRIITGTGINAKFGLIFRPIENSPFRIGLSMSSPTWYNLSTSNYTEILNNSSEGEYDNGYIGESYDFKFRTPWKFGLSLGTTVGKFLAVGACYDYSNYGKTDTRINTGGYNVFYGDYFDSSSSDRDMNRHTDYTLKGVSTFKFGAEFKPVSDLAVRIGYNYVSPMYNKNGYKNYTIDSPGTYYSSATDYTNWKATNRVTLGLGYTLKKFTIDAAYQYAVTNGDFYPFSSFDTIDLSDEDKNIVNATDVSNKRHQLLFTLGYSF